MNKIIHLSLARKSTPTIMDVVQSATAPGITFILDDYTPEHGATARIYILKGDAEVYNDCTLSGNQVEYVPTTGSFDVPGPCVAQVQILRGTEVAVSYRIFVQVEPNLILGSAAPATTEFDALTDLIIAAEQYEQRIEDLEYEIDHIEVPDGSITTAKLANGAVTSEKIAHSTITATNLASHAVTTGKIANDAVTSVKIANAAVTAAKIADNSIITSHIQDNSISTAKIQYGAVTETELADDSVTAAKIKDGEVDFAELSDAVNDKFDDIDATNVAQETHLTTIDSRIDQIIAGGSVDPDAELVDIRIGYDGTTYTTAGDAVRSQFDTIIERTFNYAEPNFLTKTYALITMTVENQEISLSGTPTTGGVVVISKTVTLPAGTYYFGNMGALPAAKAQLQARKVVGGADAGGIAQTAGMTYFTLDEQTDVNVRLRYYANESVDGIKIRMMIIADHWEDMFIPPYSAVDTIARDNIIRTKRAHNLVSGTDLNDCTQAGFWTMEYNSTYINDPSESPNYKMLEVVEIENRSLIGMMIIQKLTVFTVGTLDIYWRYRSGTPMTWKPWELKYSYTAFTELKETVEQLDGIRSDNTVMEVTTDVFTGVTPNKGEKLRVLSYNVANYNNDTTTFLSDEKRFNIKKMISEVRPDLIGIQEENFIDGSSKSSTEYIYAPILPIGYGSGVCAIKAKEPATNNLGAFTYSNGRQLRCAIFTINGKKVLFGTTHPVANYNSTGSSSTESINARLTQYTELFQWLHKEIQLVRVSDSVSVTCPDWDYCIIAGDMNSLTATDKTNLKNLASARNFKMANGGWLGWLETCRTKDGSLRYSLDNVIVSENVTIDSITAYQSLYGDLYSDHYPFFAEVTLIDA